MLKHTQVNDYRIMEGTKGGLYGTASSLSNPEQEYAVKVFSNVSQ